MWKCTGISSDAHASHTGSHARLARSGEPRSCGSDVRFTPRRPSSCARCTSRTHASMSHAGRIAIGSRRLPDSAWSSAFASLKISRQTLRSATSGTSSPRVWPPRPTTPGKMICAQMPISSSSSHPRSRVVRRRVRVVDLPLVQAFERPALAARACRRRRRPRPGRARCRLRRATAPRRRRCRRAARGPCTWPARGDVQRSCRSVMCVSASMTLTSSSGSVMRAPLTRSSRCSWGIRG